MIPLNVSKLYANFTLFNVKHQETFPNVIGGHLISMYTSVGSAVDSSVNTFFNLQN
jgi:hypothetical protein